MNNSIYTLVSLQLSTIHAKGFCELNIPPNIVGRNTRLATLESSYEIFVFCLQEDEVSRFFQLLHVPLEIFL